MRVGVTIVGYGPDTSNEEHVLTREAAVDLSGRRVVVPRADGTLEYADNTEPSHIERPMFLTLGAIEAGDEGPVLAFGEVIEATWTWTPSEALYLGTVGVLTQTPPGPPADFLIEVARATSPDAILFEPKFGIRLT